MLRGFLVVVLFVWGLAPWPASARAAPGPVLVLGDSLSAAYGIPAASGWVSLLTERLRTAPESREVVNASISGETTAGGLARLPKLLADHRPALVVVELGANDALRGLPIAAPRENLSRIIEQSREAGARVLLLGIEIPVNYGPQYRDSLRAMYRDLAADFNLPLVPFLLDGVALDPDLMQADGLHPTAAAQPTLLENVWPALEKALAR
ncbi:Acyl-CoA thioesterase I [Dokdonella koreensis DS-123]|uniref:Acyl-CoA thioesterase I n=2 Tax=Dokdonella TaxID=323413 RepID=A0A167GFT0_9GAMM|nr:arylesterase [Dokdonella koreensis]ANB16507.1 Acyl-CoA thioesterase I [Dokdonella koreensis DS-123]